MRSSTVPARLARALARIWFRSLQRRGEQGTQGGGPTLWVLNHPNGLLDPLVATALLDEAPRWMAKATLWKVPLLRPFLAVFRPIPVHRRSDGDATAEATARTFAAVHEAFARGESVAMFPEGVSHTRRELAPLKTGAARIVLSSPCAVSLRPAGLIYGRRERFRHSVLLRIGEPIACDDLRALGPTPEGARELTERIRGALEPLTLHGPDDGAAAIAERLAWLLAEGPHERADLEALRGRMRVLSERVRALDEPRRAELVEGVEGACAALMAAGVRADQIGFAYEPAVVARWLPGFAARLLLAPVLFPIGLWFWPAYRVTGLAIDRLTLDLDVVATYKFLLGLVVFPLWLLATIVAAGFWMGGWGVVGAVVAAVVAFAVLPLSERVAEDVQAVRGFLGRGDRELQGWADARERLLTAFPELRAWIVG
jgi:glycerol-3-phosphate O-acyltransferase / dihydroxyacetone phosphate acyltransferase